MLSVSVVHVVRAIVAHVVKVVVVLSTVMRLLHRKTQRVPNNRHLYNIKNPCNFDCRDFSFHRKGML
jgi:hypothetical protein